MIWIDCILSRPKECCCKRSTHKSPSYCVFPLLLAPPCRQKRGEDWGRNARKVWSGKGKRARRWRERVVEGRGGQKSEERTANRYGKAGRRCQEGMGWQKEEVSRGGGPKDR